MTIITNAAALALSILRLADDTAATPANKATLTAAPEMDHLTIALEWCRGKQTAQHLAEIRRGHLYLLTTISTGAERVIHVKGEGKATVWTVNGGTFPGWLRNLIRQAQAQLAAPVVEATPVAAEDTTETPEATPALTALEADVLEAILNSASGNGYDFGFADEALAELTPRFSRHSFAALIGHLLDKGLINTETLRANNCGPTLTQITLSDDLLERIQDADNSDDEADAILREFCPERRRAEELNARNEAAHDAGWRSLLDDIEAAYSAPAKQVDPVEESPRDYDAQLAAALNILPPGIPEEIRNAVAVRAVVRGEKVEDILAAALRPFLATISHGDRVMVKHDGHSHCLGATLDPGMYSDQFLELCCLVEAGRMRWVLRRTAPFKGLRSRLIAGVDPIGEWPTLTAARIALDCDWKDDGSDGAW